MMKCRPNGSTRSAWKLQKLQKQKTRCWVLISHFDINTAFLKSFHKCSELWLRIFSLLKAARSLFEVQKVIFQALFKNGAKHNNAILRAGKKETWNDKILENWIQQKTRFLLRCPYFFIISLHWTFSALNARLLAVFVKLNFIATAELHAWFLRSQNAIYSSLF